MLFNIAIEPQNFTIRFYLALNESEITKLVSAFHEGRDSVMLAGEKVNIKNPEIIKIFDISKRVDQSSNLKSNYIKEIQKYANILSKGIINFEVLREFGEDVTSNFIDGEWGDGKKQIVIDPTSFHKQGSYILHTELKSKKEELENIKRYWAGGFGKGEHFYERLEDFKVKNYWQALDYDDDSNQQIAENAWSLFRQIKIGDLFIIKGYGGSHNLTVHYLGEVIRIDEEKGRLDFKKINGDLYKGDAPRGEGAGNWFNTLLEVYRKEDIEKLFFPIPTKKEDTTIKDDDNNYFIDNQNKHITIGANKFWWINNASASLHTENKEIGKHIEYSNINLNFNKREVYDYFYQLSPGDIAIGYEVSPTSRIVTLLEIIKPAQKRDGDTIIFKIIYFFTVQISWGHLISFDFFKDTEVGKSNHGSLFRLTIDQFLSIINLTELNSYKITLPNITIDNKNENQKKTENNSIDLIRNVSKIANINNDSDNGEDRLEISKDVAAFAKIMTSKNFVPPIAIALFGDWGSGKSFFMNKMKEKVTALSTSQNPNYCEGVVQIHFNAWSYLDANLWASIVTQIFEKLNQYIKNDKADPQIKIDIEKKLTNELTISKEQQEHLKKQKTENVNKLNKLRQSKRSLNGELKSKIQSIKKATLIDIIKKVDSEFKVEQKISSALNENESYVKTAEEIRTNIPKEYQNNPSALYNDAKSKATFVKEFFSKGKIICNLIWIFVILLILVIVPIWLKSSLNWAKSIDFSIPQTLACVITITIPFIKRMQSTYKKLQPIISAFWNIKEEYEQKIKNTINEFEQKEKATLLEIEQGEKQLEIIEVSIQDAEKTITDLEFKINNTLSTEALYTFIDKRSNSEDYTKHLGIISYIRKDFEILSQLFIEHTEEIRVLEFRKKLKKPLERIVLYIDDLDRCSENQVVEVLEAVNLLMAFPLFIVVVGVDPRWIKNALIKKYPLQFGTSRTKNDETVIKIDSSNYLEKIFQIPFHLKKATDENIKDMIYKLSNSATKKKSTEQPKQNNEVKDSESDSLEVSETYEKKPDLILAGTTQTTIVEMKPLEEILSEMALETEEYLELTEKEISLMQELSEIVGVNPRAVKRFVNVYKILKAHEDLTSNFDNKQKEAILLMFLLALPIGPYKGITKHIYNFIDYNLTTKTLNVYLDEYKEQIEVDERNQAVIDSGTFQNISSLHKIIKECPSGELLLDCNAQESKKHLQFIKRFTFADMI
jgi:hypothetical protein